MKTLLLFVIPLAVSFNVQAKIQAEPSWDSRAECEVTSYLYNIMVYTNQEVVLSPKQLGTWLAAKVAETCNSVPA